MKSYLSMLLGAVGLMVAGVATTGYQIVFVDETKMPKSMLNKQ